MSMLGKLLSGGEFGQWASFVTPAFFNVMPTKALWGRFKELARGTRDRDLYQRVVRERQALLARSSLGITLESSESGRAWPSDAASSGSESAGASSGATIISAEARAARVTALYFHQLLHGDTTLLDLREQAFSKDHPFIW
ncbi:MAG TPA: hypothetical protein VMG12_45240, partial [Polyangiaceae bacterium]|nr:hypothetical protein [Polyangiaceae bacterium]